MKGKRFVLAAAALLLVAGPSARLVGWGDQDQQALQAYTVRWEALHVDLTLEADGRLRVAEEQRLQVLEGALSSGWREIPWLYLDGVSDVEVWAGGQPLTFSDEPGDYHYVAEVHPGQGAWVTARDGKVQIDEEAAPRTLIEWAVPPVLAGETVTFTIRYTVDGALRLLDGNQVLVWTAVFAGRDEPVEQATARLRLPAGLSPADVSVEAGAATTTVEADDTALLTHQGPVAAGTEWSLRATLPAGATSATVPQWQQELESARTQAVWQGRIQLGAVVTGLLILAGGALAVLLVWYVWGRDRPVSLPAEYLAEPPSDLPPGIVAYLVDEEPTVKGVLADILHLATLGLISVDLREADPPVTLNWQQPLSAGEAVKGQDGEELVLAEHERTLFNTIQAALAETAQAPLSQVMAAVRGSLETVYEQMAQQTSAFFTMQPSVAQKRWALAGFLITLSSGFLAALTCCAISSFGLAVLAPAAGVAGVGIMLMVASIWMPRRTTKGAEEAARWLAYRRYIENLREYGDLPAAQRLLDEAFPYAVALGLERVALQQAESLGAQAPSWLVSTNALVGLASAPGATAGPSLGPAGGLLGGLLLSPRRLERVLTQRAYRMPTRPKPSAASQLSLDGMAERLGGSLDHAGLSLGQLLDAAAGEPHEGGLLGTLGKILEQEASGGGRGGYRARSGGRWRSSSWSRSSGRSRSSAWKPSRSRGGSSGWKRGGGFRKSK